MSWAKIPLISFNTYLRRQGDDLFKGVREVIAAIPDNDYLDADVLIDHILVEAGEFPVTFTDPWFYQGAVTNWAKRQAWAWGKMVKALAVEYDPLENYDRLEDWTDHNEHEDHDTAHSYTVSDSTTKANGNVTDGVSGFNTKASETLTTQIQRALQESTTTAQLTRAGTIRENMKPATPEGFTAILA